MPPSLSDEASKSRLLAMLSEDAEEFSHRLLEIWPDIRYANFGKFGYKTVDDGEGHLIDRPKKNLRYYSSLAAEEPFLFQVWREPEGWTPEWTGPIKDHLRITNIPRINFVYESSKLVPSLCSHMRSGRICAYYLKTDKEHLSFLNRVWRLIPKLTSNVVELWDRDTGKLVKPGYRSELWIGHHTADWCSADPGRRINDSWRPGDASALEKNDFHR